MRNITLEILKAIAVLLVLLPVVDLVDQHRISGEVQGSRKEHQKQAVGPGGMILHTSEPPHFVLLDNNNHTRIRDEEEGATRRSISGNWDSLSPTRSDTVGASASNSREHFQKHSGGLEMIFPSSLSSMTSASESASNEKKYYSSPSASSSSSSSSSSSTYPKISSRTITEHHVHVVPSMTTSTTTSFGGGAGVRKDANNKGSNHLASFAVEPPLPLASSTRVTGPYFESESNNITISAKAGQSVFLPCTVILLGGRTVSWLKREKDNAPPLLLTVGNSTYNGDSRLGLRYRYPNNWRLGIDSVNKGDEGIYECQISSHPPKKLIYHLKVIAPSVVILDENGHTVTERHYKVDSSLHLTCRASHVDKFVDKVVWLKGDRPLPGGDSRIKVKLNKNPSNGEATAFLSVLSVRKSDSGTYTCIFSNLANFTVTVHVLNGELPAAVQHESSSNRLAIPKTSRLAAVALLMSASTTLFIFPPQFKSSYSILLTTLFAITFFTC